LIAAPVIPFITEEIFKNLTGKQSVHLEDWPKPKPVNQKLLEQMVLVRRICELGHAARKKAGIRVRQPLAKIRIKNQKLEIKNDDELVQVIKEELNVKQVIFEEDKGELKVKLDFKLTPALKAEGDARELVRQIQQQRKKQGCRLDQKIVVYAPGLPTDPALRQYLQQKVLAAKLLSAKSLKIKLV